MVFFDNACFVGKKLDWTQRTHDAENLLVTKLKLRAVVVYEWPYSL